MVSKTLLSAVLLACTVGSSATLAQQPAQKQTGLWMAYEQSLKGAKHIDLTHAFVFGGGTLLGSGALGD